MPPMRHVRRLFLDAASVALDLVRSPAVAARWDEPSALRSFSVRGLAGHLAGRTTDAVIDYLDRPEPEGESLLDAPRYYATVLTGDLDDDLNRGVRERGEAYASQGHDALVERAQATLETLRARLPAERDDRRVEVIAGLALTLDDYLVTRLLELLVHTDDLAVSVGVPTPPPDPGAGALVAGCLVDLARHRHGDVAVLRALARGERDDVRPFPAI